MAKAVMEDDCLAPEGNLRIDFKGSNPFRFYGEIVAILRDVLEIRSMHVWERDFRWDISVEPRKFFYKVVARKPYDNWTDGWFEFTFQGTQPSDLTKDGEMVIFVTSKIRTAMPENTIWQRSPLYKSLRWLYFRTFYNDARRILINKCLGETGRLVERIQTVLHILPPREA